MKASGLGRGLDALFTDNASAQGESVTQLAAALILPDENQNRSVFPDDSLSELAASIRAHGILQPLLVRPDQNGTYRIIAGERRFRAGKMCGLKIFPVIIKELSVSDAAEVALVENLQREDLNPVDEARGFLRLTETFGLTQEQAAERVGKSRSAVANALRLLKLPQKILSLLAAGTLSAGHARAILSLPSEEKRAALCAKILDEKLSVRAAEQAAKRLLRDSSPQDQTALAYRKELESRLSVRLGRRARLHPAKSGKGGKLTLSYQNTEDLEELIALFAGEQFLLQ